MALVDVLFGLLTSGAGLVASGAVGEFAKGAGKTAFEALKARLTERHAIRSLPLLEEARNNPAFEAAVKADLDRPEITQDAEVLNLAEQLRKAIEDLPEQDKVRYAVDIETIRAGGNLIFEAVEGVKAKSATAVGDMAFRNVKAPPGK